MERSNDKRPTPGVHGKLRNPSRSDAGRREFVKMAAVAGAGLLIVKSESVRGSQANSALRLGIIGCGGRGNAVGSEFVRGTDTRVVALMDLFDDRLNETRQRFDKMAEERNYGKLSPPGIALVGIPQLVPYSWCWSFVI